MCSSITNNVFIFSKKTVYIHKDMHCTFCISFNNSHFTVVPLRHAHIWIKFVLQWNDTMICSFFHKNIDCYFPIYFQWKYGYIMHCLSYHHHLTINKCYSIFSVKCIDQVTTAEYIALVILYMWLHYWCIHSSRICWLCQLLWPWTHFTNRL